MEFKSGRIVFFQKELVIRLTERRMFFCCAQKGEDAFIITSYEVIKFIEHGNRCRPVMDSVPGELLIYRLKRCPEVEKACLFRWIGGFVYQIEQFHRCRNDQSYRYINPYSVLITREEKLLLLDLEAESNAFVLKNMQTRAMRNHFIRPAALAGEQTKIACDLYGYAKTIQFLLANAHVTPSLTKWEEHRFEKIIEKCLCENPRKQYENFKQIQKELPSGYGAAVQEQKKKKQYGIMAVGLLIVLLFAFLKNQALIKEKQQLQEQTERYMQNQSEQKEKGMDFAGEERKTKEAGTTEEKEEDWEEADGEEKNGPRDGMDELAEATDRLYTYLLKNTAKDNQEVIEQGEELRRELLRYLSAAYDREERAEKALEAYEELCTLEVQKPLLETAYIRRMTLEMEQGREEVLQTGDEALERLPDSMPLAEKYIEIVWEKEIPKEEGMEKLEQLLLRFPDLKNTVYYQELKNRYEIPEKEMKGTEDEGNRENKGENEEQREEMEQEQ